MYITYVSNVPRHIVNHCYVYVKFEFDDKKSIHMNNDFNHKSRGVYQLLDDRCVELVRFYEITIYNNN